MKRVMIAGISSGCGKTTITCALLQALVNRKMQVVSFKCGPDYIDPMFHRRIIGTKAGNLDNWFCSRETVNGLLQKSGGELSVIEGVMGFYDGVGSQGSSRKIALDTGTPVALVIDCKGMGMSIGAVLKGFLTFQKPNPIAGVIFNRLPESLVSLAKDLCREMQAAYLGRFPYCVECSIESRHLGLVTAGEIAGLKEKLQQLAKIAEEHLDLDLLLSLARQAQDRPGRLPQNNAVARVQVAVAMDEAFCFYYEENLSLLRMLGCEIVPFSPLRDKKLPENVDGLLLGGGYPELYAEALSENRSMLESVRTRIGAGLPVIAECGGFLYLHRTLEDETGKRYPMAGVFEGDAYKTKKLQRFGYVTLTAQGDNLLCRRGEAIKAHEFHYWDSTCPGEAFRAKKASSKAVYSCVQGGPSMYAGFPHLYFYADPKIAENFVKKCLEYQIERSL